MAEPAPEAEAFAAIRTLQEKLGFTSATRLYKVASKTLDLDLPKKDLKDVVKRVVSEESSKQVLAKKPPYDGKIASRALDDRWAADLIDYTARPHKQYKYVLVVQDIFSRKLWTRPLVNDTNMAGVFLKFLREVDRKPRQLVTDGASTFRSKPFADMIREQDMDHQIKTSVNDIATVDRAMGTLKEKISVLSQQPGNPGNWYDNLEKATDLLNAEDSRYLATKGHEAAPDDVTGDDEASKALRFELRRKNAGFMEHNAEKAEERRETLAEQGAFRTLLAGPLSTVKIRKGMPRWTAEKHEVQSIDGNLVTDTDGKTRETRQVLAVPKTSTAVQTPAYFAGGSVPKDNKRRALMDKYIPELLALLRTKPNSKMSLSAVTTHLRTKNTFEADMKGLKDTKVLLKLYPGVFKLSGSYVTDASPPPTPGPAAARARWKSLTPAPVAVAPAPAPAPVAPAPVAPAAPAAPAPVAPAAPGLTQLQVREKAWRQERKAEKARLAAGGAPETEEARQARLARGRAAGHAVRSAL
jgi:hypothetical protein